jgi:hypothetical protein
MSSNTENRDKTRFEHVTAVTLENNEIGVQRSARMYNYSASGLYIESDHRLEPETEIRLGLANSPFAAEPDAYETFRGSIKWRKKLKHSVFHYGYGIEIIGAERPGDNDGGPSAGSRQQARVDYSISVKYEFDNYVYEGTTENVSTGGVFIKSRNPVAVGQTVKIDIPVKKKGKIKRFTGKVTWSNRSGFGVQFIRSK